MYYNIISLWDRRCICGVSLTETSLCGVYLPTNKKKDITKECGQTPTSQRRVKLNVTAYKQNL
jgi:hypothetical protein